MKSLLQKGWNIRKDNAWGQQSKVTGRNVRNVKGIPNGG